MLSESLLDLFFEDELTFDVQLELLMGGVQVFNQIVLVILLTFMYLMNLLDLFLVSLLQFTDFSLGHQQLLGYFGMLRDPCLIDFSHIINGIFEDLDLLFIPGFLCSKESVCFRVWRFTILL